SRELLTKAREARPDKVEFWTAQAELTLNEARSRAASKGEPQSAESKELSKRNFEEAASLLDEAQNRLGDLAPLRSARILFSDADWALRRNPKAHQDVMLRVRDIAKFTKDDQTKLLREAAECLLRMDERQDAVVLWKQLANLQPEDLDARMRLFEV